MSENDGIRLSDGSVVDTEIFSNLENTLREEDPDDFQENRFSRDDPNDPVSPFTADPNPTVKNVAGKRHEERTERAQTVDEKQNAPIAPDYETWAENKNRYDLPGVDTIPVGRQRRRAERAAEVAQERGAVDRVEQKGSAKRLQGKFSPEMNETYGAGESVARVQNTAEQPERTLAHEVGHAFDYDATPTKTVEMPDIGQREIATGSSWGISEVLFNDNDADTEQLREEAKGLSERARGDLNKQPSYRRKDEELVADALSQTILEPRAAKREAPNLFERIEDAADEFGFEQAIPDPLERDPERRGFLE